MMPPLPAFTEQGDGDGAVLLLHGIGGGRAIWADDASGTLSAIASAGFHAVAIDLPGYGGSSAMQPPTLDGFVDAVMAVIEALRHRGAARRVVLLGHSMGGMIAQELLARHAGAASALILACTTAAFGRPDGAWQVQFLKDRLAPLDAGLGMVGMAARLVPAMLGDRARPQADAIAQQVMSAVPEATYRAALGAIAGFDRRQALARIAVPTLLLAGEQDRTAPADVMQRMAGRIADAEFASLPGVGHIANVEAPAMFNQAVVSFLQRRLATD
jgi:pimeloyl-ACP methyl ester carboxylesterase